MTTPAPADCNSRRGIGSSSCSRSSALLGFLLLSACQTIHYDYSKEPDPRQREYAIGPLDQLSIVVWKNRDLSADVTVRPDGIITLPLIGDVQAKGRSPSELKAELTRRYGEFVRAEDAVVTVTVTNVQSYHFTVTGAVEHAGVLSSRYYVTVVEALSMAGGPSRFAGNVLWIIRHDGDGKTHRIPFDIPRLLSGLHPEENLVVLPGDILQVP